ncbi:tail fiber domain-containing protein [Ekhidna sp.]
MKKFYFLLLCLLFSNLLFAQKIPFQGRLLDAGKPFNGTADIQFSISSPSWTETINDVVVTDGYYAVVLGQITPLPDTLFQVSREVSLNITVNGETLSPVILYAPMPSPSIAGGRYEITNNTGDLRAELSYFEPNDAGSLVLYGANDSTKVILGTTTPGYEGALFLYDSIRNQGVRIESRNDGGRFQFVQRDNANSLKSAIVGSTFGDENAGISLYGGDQEGSSIALMVDMYASNLDQGGAPLSDGYRRGGIDIYNYLGSQTHNIYSATDPGGSDPSGFSGSMNIWGTSTPNIGLTAPVDQNNNLGHINVYGQNDDGGSWTVTNIGLHTQDIGGGNTGAVIFMGNSQNGGIYNETIVLDSHNGTGQGGLVIVRDAADADRIYLDGGNGSISANRTDGGSAINFFVAGDNGGISIQNAADQNKLFYEASAGTLELRDDPGATTITLDGNLGDINATGTVTAAVVTQTSDRRLKKNIQSLEKPLENVLKLRGVSYQWKDEFKSQRNQIGVIAQEVEEVYPEFVHTNDEGMKAVNYAQMTPVLIGAIKELNKKVEKLEAENTELKTSLTEVQTLRTEMDQLMKMLGGSKAASK